MPRDKSRPGKVAFWTIDQTLEKMFEEGNYRRRKRRARMAMEKMVKEEINVNVNMMFDTEKKGKRSSDNPHSIERILNM